MGEFIGGLGAVFILSAAAAVIAKLLLDVNIIKRRETVITYGKVTLLTIVIGAVYVSAAVLMYNELHGRTNFFDYPNIFSYLGAVKPLFGRHAFIAMYISILSTSVSSCLLYSMISKTADRENTEKIMLLIASLPYVFILFTPTVLPIAFMAAVIAVYLMTQKKKEIKLVRLIEERLINNAIIFRIAITAMILFNGAALCIMIRGI